MSNQNNNKENNAELMDQFRQYQLAEAKGTYLDAALMVLSEIYGQRFPEPEDVTEEEKKELSEAMNAYFDAPGIAHDVFKEKVLPVAVKIASARAGTVQ